MVTAGQAIPKNVLDEFKTAAEAALRQIALMSADRIAFVGFAERDSVRGSFDPRAAGVGSPQAGVTFHLRLGREHPSGVLVALWTSRN